MNLEQFSLLELFHRGGPVMWVLLLVSVVSLAIFIERALYLHRGHIRSTEFLEGIKNIVQKRRLVEALTLAEETPGPVANLVKAGLLHHEEGEEKIRFAIQEAGLVEIPALERRIGSIGAIAHIAPLIGLLGTVLGMVDTFYQFEQTGVYATSASLSAGLWQAMLTTAGGLAVSIAAHLGHHFLAGRVRALIYDMEWAGSDLVDFLVYDRTVPKQNEEIDK
jgi:biopolymer transport protein ExbB